MYPMHSSKYFKLLPLLVVCVSIGYALAHTSVINHNFDVVYTQPVVNISTTYVTFSGVVSSNFDRNDPYDYTFVLGSRTTYPTSNFQCTSVTQTWPLPDRMPSSESAFETAVNAAGNFVGLSPSNQDSFHPLNSAGIVRSVSYSRSNREFTFNFGFNLNNLATNCSSYNVTKDTSRWGFGYCIYAFGVVVYNPSITYSVPITYISRNSRQASPAGYETTVFQFTIYACGQITTQVVINPAAAGTYRGYLSRVATEEDVVGGGSCVAGSTRLLLSYRVVYDHPTTPSQAIVIRNQSSIALATNCYNLTVYSISATTCTPAQCFSTITLATGCRPRASGPEVFIHCDGGLVSDASTLAPTALDSMFFFGITSHMCTLASAFNYSTSTVDHLWLSNRDSCATPVAYGLYSSDSIQSHIIFPISGQTVVTTIQYDVGWRILPDQSSAIAAPPLSTDTNLISVVSGDYVPFVTFLSDINIRQQWDLIILPTNLTITMFDVNSTRIGSVLYVKQLIATLSPACFPVLPKNYTNRVSGLAACSGINGCDGFVVAVSCLRNIQPTAVYAQIDGVAVFAPFGMSIATNQYPGRRLLQTTNVIVVNPTVVETSDINCLFGFGTSTHRYYRRSTSSSSSMGWYIMSALFAIVILFALFSCVVFSCTDVKQQQQPQKYRLVPGSTN
jgi:hypothetical protein